MNDPAAAGEQIAESETGAEPELSLDPHVLGKQIPPEPEGEEVEAQEEGEQAEESDSPSDGEDNADTKPDDQVEKEDPLDKKVRELAYENRQLKRQLEQRRELEQSDDEPEPEPLKTLQDFGNDEQAYNDYLRQRDKEEIKRELRQEQRRERDRTEAQKLADQYAAREDAFEAENPGFKERIHDENLPITNEMAMFIADPESEVGLHIGDFLSRHKDEAYKIAIMPPAQQVRELVKLEARIGKEVAKAKAEKTKASKAPAPPTGLDGSDPGLKASPDDPATADKMSHSDWLKARNKQLEARQKKA